MQTLLPEPGDLVGGVYRTERELGSGSMGVVFLAEDESLGRHVAVKFIHSSLLDDGFRERFTMEARAMARVSHPNALHIYAFGDHGGAPYFVMEYLRGGTLETWMTNHREPDIDRALDMLVQICAGVSAIHDAGTVHRDIKPSNVLLGERDVPRIADLGLAILLRRDGLGSREIVGTPEYMAPEVAFPGTHDEGLGERADVYSLACMAYELLAGRTPFLAETSQAMMYQHAAVPVTPPSAFRPATPRSLDAAILSALAKNPADRTPTAEAFRLSLEAARAQTREPPRILIADDNDDFRELLAAGLDQAFPGATIECVKDGRAALDAFDRSRPSLVIFDLRMPELDGMSLAELLRERDPEALVPLVVLTGSGGASEWAALSDIGVLRMLVKPVALDDVVALVHKIVRSARPERPFQP